ncbi:hypothetical protein [Phocaeicola faecicola]|uniref:hypothetical protein n=1 Tax=Phocaeicola faecicola TaxID=2739389 RepID=UPI0015E72884|nr:hypothetical protein [Phocaeicola faecicola]
MKRNFVSAVLLALVAMFCFGSIAQAKEKKKKKERKERVCMAAAGKDDGHQGF